MYSKLNKGVWNYIIGALTDEHLIAAIRYIWKKNVWFLVVEKTIGLIPIIKFIFVLISKTVRQNKSSPRVA